MRINDFAKDIKIIDLIVLWLDEQGFSDNEIATMAGISTQTLHNTKNRLKPFLDSLKAVKGELVEYGNHDINTIINTFSQAFGTTKSTKWDRFAAKRLLAKYPSELLVGAINALAGSQNDKYAPSVRSISQFEEKLPNIARFLNQKSDNGQIINL